MEIPLEESSEIHQGIESLMQPAGFESHPFLIGWYNEKVDEKFRLSYDDNTLAFVVISRPSMFEKSFLPYLCSSITSAIDPNDGKGESTAATIRANDPIDQCMVTTLNKIKEKFSTNDIATLHDFELGPTRRPKILVQTAGHVSGAVRFYKESDLTNKELLKDTKSSKIYPVCIHPDFGGWFALRAVCIFKDIQVPSLPRKEPKDILNEEQIARLLKLYNDDWKDNRFRDIIKVKEKYSALQIEYFHTSPCDRLKLVEKYLLQKMNNNSNSTSKD